MFRPNTRFKRKALGINIYGGGFTLGALKHFNVVAQLEEIKLGHKTFALNFTGIDHPICDPTEWALDRYHGVDLVYSNPPCVPHSDASQCGLGGRRGNKRADRLSDPLLELTVHTMKAAISLRPKVFICESVENAYNYAQSWYAPWRDLWHKAGYAVTWFLTDAALHGAPCRRRRFHFIAHRVALDLPRAPKNPVATTVQDAIEDLRHVSLGEVGPAIPQFSQHTEVKVGRWNSTDRYRHLLQRVKPMGRLIASLPAKLPRGCPKPSTFVQRLAWDLPSGTVLRFGHKIHPDAERWITYREGLRLLTYPDEFRCASEIDAADAVIPCVAELLAGIARRSIDNAEPVKRGEFNIVDWRSLGLPLHKRVAQ